VAVWAQIYATFWAWDRATTSVRDLLSCLNILWIKKQLEPAFEDMVSLQTKCHEKMAHLSGDTVNASRVVASKLERQFQDMSILLRSNYYVLLADNALGVLSTSPERARFYMRFFTKPLWSLFRENGPISFLQRSSFGLFRFFEGVKLWLHIFPNGIQSPLSVRSDLFRFGKQTIEHAHRGFKQIPVILGRIPQFFANLLEWIVGEEEGRKEAYTRNRKEYLRLKDYD
jgi:hypothetical protein